MGAARVPVRRLGVQGGTRVRRAARHLELRRVRGHEDRVLSFDYFVIFGAAVRPDGRPSGTLRRRVEGAHALGRQSARARYLATGGVGREGPAEAEVMRAILVARGVAEDQILVEDRATDTLSSAVLCTEILKERRDAASVTVCTSRYHRPRCQLLFRILGVATRAGAVPSDRRTIGIRRWLYYVLRELAATPWDAMLLSGMRLLRRASR